MARTTPRFIPGLRLSEMFYRDAVRPVLAEHLPRLRYSAALIGPGSEVQGFDDRISTDHHWGLRLLMFVDPADAGKRDPICELLSWKLPRTYLGYSTHFGEADAVGVRHAEAATVGPIRHMVEVHDIEAFFASQLGFDPFRRVAPGDWLNRHPQTYRELTGGRVYYDGLKRLNAVRRRLEFYPRDVWLHLMARHWQELSDEEAFVGRCGHVGDEIGSAVVAARQVQRLMSLAFLIERVYEPYSKWCGTAFSRLRCAKRLKPALASVLRANNWHERERGLTRAYEQTARMHNELSVTRPVMAKATQYFGRPFGVIWGNRIAAACRDAIRDRALRKSTRAHPD